MAIRNRNTDPPEGDPVNTEVATEPMGEPTAPVPTAGPDAAQVAAATVSPGKSPAIPDALRAPNLMRAAQKVARGFAHLDDVATALGSDLIEWDIVSPSFDVVQKDVFEGLPMVVIAWKFNESDKYQILNSEGNPIPAWFVSALVASYDDDGNVGRPVIVNDGGTGIYKQLEQVSDEFGVFGGIKCPKGLRRSTYDYTDPQGKVSEATTWYLG